MKPLLLLALPALGYLLLVFRVSAFRKDEQWRDERTGRKRVFAWPYSSWGELFSRDNYTEEGQRLFPWLIAALVVLMIYETVVLVKLASGL